jgi:uncharacterized membrane protein YbhN (UPF0104 family)
MPPWLRKSWPWLKAGFALAILFFVGRRFVQDLRNEDLWKIEIHPGWVVASGILYVLSLGCLVVYWYRMLRGLGQQPVFLGALRAHYIGQMGKYVPGKAWALLLRSGMLKDHRVRVSVAVYSSFYEVLTTMAGGALFAAVWFGWQAGRFPDAGDWRAFLNLLRLPPPEVQPVDAMAAAILAFGLFLLIGTFVAPPVFNRLVGRIAQPFRESDAAPLPHVRTGLLLQGAGISFGFWLLTSASLWAMLQAVMVKAPALTAGTWAHETAYMALAYVAGFIMILVPSGLGVRESLLVYFLVPELYLHSGGSEPAARATAIIAVVLLRVIWTATELLMVGLVYWLPSPWVRSQ